MALKEDEILSILKDINDNTVPSFVDSLDEHRENIISTMKDSVPIKDGYGNSLTATGFEDKVKEFTEYRFSNESLNWPLWLALYNDSWVFRRVIDKPATDMVRSGVSINLKDEQLLEEIYRMLKKFRFDLIQLIQWGALFGGSVAIMMPDSYQDLDFAAPLNIKKLQKAKTIKLYVTDRWYGVSTDMNNTVSNMNSLDYGKPKMYNISFPNGHQITVHHDYILRYEHRVAPKLIKQGQLQGWGYAEGSHIFNELSRDDQLKSAVTSLINKALIEVIKMAGMRGVFMGQDEASKNQLQQRLQMVNWGRTFNSLTFLDKEDDYQEHGFSGLTGLADLLENNMWQVSAAVEMQGVLFGDLKQGFSNDEDALERYDETILNRNENYYRPIIEKLLWFLYKYKGITEKIDFEFNSLLVKKHDEERMNSLKSYQEFLSNLLNDGVITTQLYAKSLNTYINQNQINLNMDENYINSLDDKLHEEMEGIDDLNVDVDFDETKEEENLDVVKPKDSIFKRIFRRKREQR